MHPPRSNVQPIAIIFVFAILFFILYCTYGFVDILNLLLWTLVNSLKATKSACSNCPSSDAPYPALPGVLNCAPSVMTPSASVPTSVNRVKYADIVSIAALGDSITVASLSKNWPHQAAGVYYGNSYVTGGDRALEEHMTLANILRKFNPNLKGVSFTEGRSTQEQGFNAAVGGQCSFQLMAQARDLVERMRQQNVTNAWKIVTIFIGTNDVGSLGCFTNDPRKPTSLVVYVNSLVETLEILRDNLPNTFVMPIVIWPPQLTIEMTWIVKHGNRDCDNNTDRRIARDNLINAYQSITHELERSPRFQSDTFTVVIQPLFENVRDIYRDSTGQFFPGFYAEDSFHLSKWGNGVFAKYLWNGMLEKVGQKSKPNNLSDTSSKLNCPEEDFPFIRTVENSKE